MKNLRMSAGLVVVIASLVACLGSAAATEIDAQADGQGGVSASVQAQPPVKRGTVKKAAAEAKEKARMEKAWAQAALKRKADEIREEARREKGRAKGTVDQTMTTSAGAGQGSDFSASGSLGAADLHQALNASAGPGGTTMSGGINGGGTIPAPAVAGPGSVSAASNVNASLGLHR